MNYAEFKRNVGKAGLTIKAFSALINVRPTSISNYANKPEIPQKYAVLAVLLGDAVERKLNVRELLARNEIDWPSTRGDQKVTSLADYRGRPKR